MTLLQAKRTAEILLIEDNMADIELTREALERGKIDNHLYTTRDGETALAFLGKVGVFTNVPTPDLILLDLNLPRKNGREVLAEIKSDSKLKQIPIVILTTSEAGQDIARSYALHANCFVSKPVNFARFVEVVQQIGHFWFSVVTLPDGRGRPDCQFDHTSEQIH